MMYALSTNQEYFADKLSIAIMLAPVITMNYCESTVLDIILANHDRLVSVTSMIGIYELFS